MSSRTRPGRFATRGPRRTPRTRRSRRRDEDEDEIPEVYRGMLAEAEARENENGSTSSGTDRPAKRFKPAGYRATAAEAPAPVADREQDAVDVDKDDEHTAKKLQTVYNSPSESEESDIEWEEVDTQQAALPASASSITNDVEPLQITLGQQDDRKRRVVRRKPVTAAERKLRLDVHKTHLLCLLCHVQRRNLWCNDEEVQGFVKKMLSKHIRSQLNPPEDRPQHTRSAMFLDGLNQAGDVFHRRFRVTKPGLRLPHWAHDSDSLKRRTENIMSDAEVFLSREDFRNQAKTMQGSRDFGAQLFCALLRSVAVEARLVCSLQPLPFTGTMAVLPKPEPQHIVISSDDTGSQTDGPKPEASKSKPIRRLGRPSFKPSPAPVRNTFPTRPVPTESSYPVFWVEAFNEAFQKWVVIDPMVTKTLAKPHRLEPPANDPYNLMSYVVAFEEDASARDVTRRYTKVFNAKIRKLRVESTKNGEIWWKRVLQHFEKPFLEDRDELEIGELTAKTASEPMPRNMQDFKGHPIYALERHLRSNEIIFPKRVTGHVSLGKSGSKGQTEPVYRRSDVHTLRSANKWYRLGRDIKMGEQALKRIPARNRGVVLDEGEEPEETTLYAFFQTELYKPPPVVKGKVPKNAYGNLDIYVPSMVPPGGVHIRHLDAAHAARLLDIDYADAVTGFNFKGRHGTAVLQGIVVASEYHEAVLEVLHCLEEEKLRNAVEEKTAEVLRTWKNFLLKLRIAERVKGYAVEGEADDEAEVSALENSEEPEEFGGGFLPTDAEVTNPPQPAQEASAQDEMGGGFLPDSEDVVSPVRPWKDSSIASDSRAPEQGDLAGGFVPEDENPNSSVPTPPRRQNTGTKYELVVIPSNAPNTSTANQHLTQDHRPPQPVSRALGLGNSIEEPISVPSSANTPASIGVAAEAPIVVDSSMNNDSASASVEILSRAPSQAQSRTQSIEPVPELSYPEDGDEDESEIDKGSLLSEDPDDEDAVPEWLMSD
ncbi:putative DNA repair protein Rad4 [Aspergillus undulatus]|uniref:putative DNA repair protein Rad4 n=1 Tax=Aspergillus undulatus TaxID=1810928 RepID=UPI003CCCD176